MRSRHAMQRALLFRAVVIAGVAGLLLACSASKNVTQTQHQLRQIGDYRNTDISAVSEQLNTYRKEDEDRVLYHLEQGMLHHYQENWEQSSKHFQKSERAIERLYTKSISQNLQAMLTNDLRLAYDGEAYEDIYLNAFKCLNYLHRDNREGAMVEVRRATHKLEQLEDRYRGLAESVTPDTAQTVVAEADKELEGIDLIEKDEADDTAPLEIQQHSAMGRFVGTVLHAKNNSPDDARIELAKLRAALHDQERTEFLSTFPSDASEAEAGQVSIPSRTQLTEPDAYNTMLVAFHGHAPQKREQRFQFNIFVDEEEVQLDFAVPILRLPETRVDRVRAHVAGKTVTVPLIEDLQATAQAMFEQKRPIIYTRAVIRSFLKAGATEAGEQAAEDEYGEAAGWLAEQVGEAMSGAVAQADTRGWQTMPGLARATVVKLPPGTHTVTFEFLSGQGHVVEERTRRVEVTGPQDLALAESICVE